MFVFEGVTGIWARSTALLADSLDMFADATVYGIALYAVGRSARHKTQAASLSGLFQMGLAGLILGETIRCGLAGSEPISAAMVGMGFCALMANLYCLKEIAQHRQGEVHMRASWIFSRNDVIANLSVMVSGFLVSIFKSRLPDLAIGLAISAIVLRGGMTILQDARRDRQRTNEPFET